MPWRKTPLVTGGYYHVFNRGVDGRETFSTKRESQRALLALWFYRFHNIPFRLSHFISYGKDRQQEAVQELELLDQHVRVHAYCLMPNHFHILVEQQKDDGISQFVSNFQNSYTKFFNERNNRKGPLFSGRFKSVLVENDEQLIHLSRYIHLNPLTGYLLANMEELMSYPYSSLPNYLGTSNNLSIADPEPIMEFFNSAADYQAFLADQASYQRELKQLERLTFKH